MMKYFVSLLILIGFSGTVSAIPEFTDPEKVYGADVITIGQILSYHDEEKYRFYEISILKELKNSVPTDSITMRSVNENGVDSMNPHNVFEADDLVLLYLKDYGRGFWESTNFSEKILDGQLQYTINKITELVEQTEKQSPEPPSESVTSNIIANQPPLKQWKSGISIDKIQCKEGLELVMKKSNGQPICVKGTSVKNLTLRGYIHEYNGMDGEIPSDEIVIGIPHALPVEPKQSETPESLLAQFEILANENLILQDQRILKIQEIDDARANKSNSISTLEAELDVINEKLKQSGIKLDQIRTATSKFYEIDPRLKATLEKAQQILTDNHDIIPWNGLGIDPKSKTLLIEFESSDLADKYAPVIRELIGEDIPITIFVGKNTFD